MSGASAVGTPATPHTGGGRTDAADDERSDPSSLSPSSLAVSLAAERRRADKLESRCRSLTGQLSELTTELESPPLPCPCLTLVATRPCWQVKSPSSPRSLTRRISASMPRRVASKSLPRRVRPAAAAAVEAAGLLSAICRPTPLSAARRVPAAHPVSRHSPKPTAGPSVRRPPPPSPPSSSSSSAATTRVSSTSSARSIRTATARSRELSWGRRYELLECRGRGPRWMRSSRSSTRIGRGASTSRSCRGLFTTPRR